jgi:hypothetical protein
MKKFILFASFIVLAITSIAQPKVFGITIDGQSQQWMDSALSTKDFVLDSDSANMGHLHGYIAGKPVDIWVAATPITHIAYKIVVESYPYNDWAAIKKDWLFYSAELEATWGNPWHDYEFFRPPFKEGDGHEMTAIEKEYCAFGKFWTDGSNTYTIAVEIRKYKEVWASFENTAGANLYDKEEASLQTPTRGTGNKVL